VDRKTILLIDDEPGLIEALEDALVHEGHAVLKARTAEQALEVLKTQAVDLATVDIMMPPGKSLEARTTSHTAGLFVCQHIRREYPEIELFCLSVVSDPDIIRRLRKSGTRFLRKGETPLRTVLELIRSKLSGIAYSTDRERHRNPR